MSAVLKTNQSSWFPITLRFDNQKKTKIVSAFTITAVGLFTLSQIPGVAGTATCCNADGGECYTCEPDSAYSYYDKNGLWEVPDWIAAIIEEIAQRLAEM